MSDLLSRVNIDVGYVIAVPDRKSGGKVNCQGRVRYTLNTEVLESEAVALGSSGHLHVSIEDKDSMIPTCILGVSWITEKEIEDSCWSVDWGLKVKLLLHKYTKDCRKRELSTSKKLTKKQQMDHHVLCLTVMEAPLQSSPNSAAWLHTGLCMVAETFTGSFSGEKVAVQKLDCYAKAAMQFNAQPSLANEEIFLNKHVIRVQDLLQDAYTDFIGNAGSYCDDNQNMLPVSVTEALQGGTAKGSAAYNEARAFMSHYALAASTRYSLDAKSSPYEAQLVVEHNKSMVELANAAEAQAEGKFKQIFPAMIAEARKNMEIIRQQNTWQFATEQIQNIFRGETATGEKPGEGASGERRVIEMKDGWRCDICNTPYAYRDEGLVWDNHPFWGEFISCLECDASTETLDTLAKKMREPRVVAPIVAAGCYHAYGINLSDKVKQDAYNINLSDKARQYPYDHRQITTPEDEEKANQALQDAMKTESVTIIAAALEEHHMKCQLQLVQGARALRDRLKKAAKKATNKAKKQMRKAPPGRT